MGHTPELSLPWGQQTGSSPPTWGIRPSLPNSAVASAVHPHLRGAYLAKQAENVDASGSSPPTWGILCRHKDLRTVGRFIPTYVGHTTHTRPKVPRITVHPHLRGAYLPVDPVVDAFVRFIPTYVGHTSPCVMQFGVHSVHPHLRGAYEKLLNGYFIVDGSSPPTWGILPPKTVWATALTVHPHLRGAYTGPP